MTLAIRLPAGGPPIVVWVECPICDDISQEAEQSHA
jgi:hypothetical protein